MKSKAQKDKLETKKNAGIEIEGWGLVKYLKQNIWVNINQNLNINKEIYNI